MKLKRLFTAILSAALTLSLCAMPAMADDTGTTAAGTTGATTARADGTPVWSKTTGSITIHKYEYNPTDGTTGTLGTGADDESENVPADAKPLGGVTFEIYQVQNEAWLKDYYGGGDLNTTGKLLATDYYESDSDGKITVKGTPAPTPVRTITTNDTTGIAKTTPDLPLGLYLVVETKAPDKVTTPAKPFLVSVPMTRIADNDTTNKLTDWIYDVHVYPKNNTTYGKVTIKKTGYTGGDSGVALKGVKFILQKKISSSPEDWTKITQNDSNQTVYDLTTDANGQITIAGLSQGEYRIYEEAYSDTSANKGYILDAEYHYFTVEKDGKIKVGVNAAIPNATIEVANHRPDMEKKVKKDGSWEHDAQYGVGDTVPYQITIKVPQNIEKLTTFTVTDTPTGLTDNVSSIEVKDGTTDLTKDTHYTVTDGGNGFTITFKPAEMTAYAGKELVITYNATVNNNAVVGGDGNLNKATLTYTNKINSHGTPATPNTNTIEDSAVMYSFGIKVVKTDGDTNALEGVEFNLYKAMTTADANTHHYTPLSAADVTKYGLGSAGPDKVWVCVKSGLKTNAEGVIDTSVTGSNFIGGLANGDYYLVETKTVKDYNLLTKPVEVKLYVTADVNWSVNTTFDPSGKLTKRTVTSTTFNHTNHNGDATKTELAVANIINRKGFTLPVTGGFGTLLFSGIGLLLVLVGVSVLFSLKKKTNRA